MELNTNAFTLPEIKDFIGGDSVTFSWDVKDSAGAAIDTTMMGMTFALISYSDRYGEPVYKTTCTNNTEKSTFTLTLESDVTEGLVGKYIYQLTLTTADGLMKNRQGLITINKNMIPPAPIPQPC